MNKKDKEKLNKFYAYLKAQCLKDSEEKCDSDAESWFNIGKNHANLAILGAFVKIVLKNEG